MGALHPRHRAVRALSHRKRLEALRDPLAQAGRLVVLAIVGALGLGACSSAVPQVTDADLTRAQGRDPSVSEADLQHGRTLYLSRCTSCHAPFSPASRDVEAWQNDVAKMRTLAGLDAGQERLILLYLETFARP